MLTRRVFLRSAAVAVAASRVAADTPVTGTADDRFTPFDNLMTTLLADHKVPGAAVAVGRNGKLVYSRGFGYADADRKVKVEPDALFRIASVSKPLTAVGVLQLVEKGKIKLDDPILKHVPLKPHLAPDDKADPRLDDVTVRHCLQHTGGWDRGQSGDPIAIPKRIADALKIDLPVPPEAVVRYALGRPLDFDPGTKYAYSNVGYLLLGRAIESAGGRTYEEYIRTEVLKPVGVTRAALGRALPENRAKGEVGYFDMKKRTGPCVYPPRVGKQVPLPDGQFNLEGFEAHGGWIASAPDLVRFANAFHDPAACKLLSEKSIATMWERPKVTEEGAYYGCGWQVRSVEKGINVWHTGLIMGTAALLVRRHDGLVWAVLFNASHDPDGKYLAEVIDPLVHKAAAGVTWE
jgi:CubicO group peptidase (beta-lactamase class C family)